MEKLHWIAIALYDKIQVMAIFFCLTNSLYETVFLNNEIIDEGVVLERGENN